MPAEYSRMPVEDDFPPELGKLHALQGRTIQACVGEGLTGLGHIVGDVDMGLRSPTRFSPGFHITGLSALREGELPEPR